MIPSDSETTADTAESLSDRSCRITDAYQTGIDLREALCDGACLRVVVSEVALCTDFLEDGYPDWHPAPDSFRAMLRLFLYREITGDSYRTIETYQEFAEPFGLDHIPDESVLSRTWRNRFDDSTREYVTVVAHFVVKEINDYGPTVSAVRPKKEVTDSKPESREENEPDESTGAEFSDGQIRRTTLWHGITASTGSTLVERRMPPTRIRGSSSYRRSWEWSVVGPLRVLHGFNTAEARSTAHTVTPTCER